MPTALHLRLVHAEVVLGSMTDPEGRHTVTALQHGESHTAVAVAPVEETVLLAAAGTGRGSLAPGIAGSGHLLGFLAGCTC